MNRLFVLAAALTLTACKTSSSGENVGPDHTRAYYISVESSRAAVRVETNHIFAGQTPFVLKIFGDPPGTFHDFGAHEFVLHAEPNSSNEYPQVLKFRTGTTSNPGERVPGTVFFDMSKPSGAVLIDSIPDR